MNLKFNGLVTSFYYDFSPVVRKMMSVKFKLVAIHEGNVYEKNKLTQCETHGQKKEGQKRGVFKVESFGDYPLLVLCV